MKKKVTIISVLILVALFIFAIRLSFIKSKQDNVFIPDSAVEVPMVENVDITKLSLEKNDSLRQAALLIQENKLTEARALLSEVLSIETDNNIRSIADITLADTYYRDGQLDLATLNMVRISAETMYPNTTRAFALTSIMQQYYGTKNTELLKVFGNLEDKNLQFVIEGAHRQIVALFPMGLSIAYLASVDMKRYKDKSKDIFDNAITKIDNDIAFQDKGVTSNYIVPNTIIAKANLMATGEKLGYTTQAEVISVYQEAITSAKQKLQIITAQFATLSYMDYLGKNQVGNEFVINEALNILKAENLTPVVLSYLAKPSVFKDLPGIVSIAKINKDYYDFFAQYVPLAE